MFELMLCLFYVAFMCNVPTIESEVAKKCRDQVKHETKKDADICHILHSPFSRPKTHIHTVRKQNENSTKTVFNVHKKKKHE